MSNRTGPLYRVRLTTETWRLWRELRVVARLLDPKATMETVARAALQAHGIQVRRRARAAGIDVEAALREVSGRSRGPFAGPPDTDPGSRVY